MADSSLHAVITADIVKSTTRIAPERRESFADALREAYGKIQERLPDALPYPIATFSGDSWQCYVEDPQAALRVGLYLRAWARFTFDVDTRFALAIGTVDFVNQSNIAESDGDAFRVSGRVIEYLSREERLIIVVTSVNSHHFRRLEEITDLLLMRGGDAIARLADRIARNWTTAQAQALMWRLLDSYMTHEKIAERWKPESVTHQSVTKHLARGGWSDLDSTFYYYSDFAEAAMAFAAWLNATEPVEPR